MRISDGSSDVCSSDLHQAQGDPDHRSEQAVAAGDEREQVGVFMPARACQLPVRVDQRQRFDVVDEGRERQPAAVDVRRQRTAEAEVVGAGLRSEEHTSELQSLMRISYAVFCLKKKKEEKKHNNYDIKTCT